MQVIYTRTSIHADVTTKLTAAINVAINVTQFAKTQHNDVFLEIHTLPSVCSMYVPKACFCSKINAVS